MELQGLAVTICLGGENRLYSSDGGEAAGKTHHLILLDVRIPPLENSKVKLVELLCRRTPVVKLHHGRLEESHNGPSSISERAASGGAAAPLWRGEIPLDGIPRSHFASRTS